MVIALMCTTVLQSLTWPLFFAVYSLMVIPIEKETTEMNLDIDRVIRLFFSLKYDLLYRLGLNGISTCLCSSTLNLSPSVPYLYIN